MNPTILTLLLLTNFSAEEPATKPVSFRNDIAPILVERCLACHGPMKSSGAFRVDTYERLMRKSESGQAIVAGKAAASDFYRLLITDEATERMPKRTDPLAKDRIELIKRWIDQGAKFDGLDSKADLGTLVPARSQPEPPEYYRQPVPVSALALAPDGKELATGGYHEVLLWNVENGQLLRRIKNVAQQTQGLAYSADGSLLAVGGGTPGEYGELKAFDPRTGKLVRVFDTSADVVLGVAFSPNGKLVASAGADRSLRVYQVTDGKEVCRVRQNADYVTSVSFNREATSVAGSSRDKMVKVFDPHTGKLQATYIGHPNKVDAVAFDSVRNIACTAGEDKRIHVWDPKAVAAFDGTAAQMEDRFKKEPPVKFIPGFEREVLALCARDGQVFSAQTSGIVRQHDLSTLKLVREYQGLNEWSCCVAADKNHVAAGSFDGTVCVWKVTDGSLVTRFVAAPTKK